MVSLIPTGTEGTFKALYDEDMMVGDDDDNGADTNTDTDGGG